MAAAVVAGIALGVALRVYVLTHRGGGFDSDEAVTGLMARHLLSDPLHHQTFYWGTNYGGTLEAMVAAIPMALFGSSIVVLKLTQVVWQAAAAILVWRIGRRLIDERAGVVAGVIAWIWPSMTVYWSTKARGFYGALAVLGLTLLLCALRLAERPDSRADWFVAGGAAGLGWWTNPQIVYLAVPAGIWLVIRNRRAPLQALRSRAWLWAIPAGLAGVAPWLYWNVRHQWLSLGGGANPGLNRGEGFFGHFERAWREGLPVTLGLKQQFTYRWIGTPAVTKFLYVATILAVAAALVVWRRGALLVVIAVFTYVVLHSLGPVAGTTSEGRYFYCLAPLLALAVARVARSPVTAALLFAVLAASALSGVRNIPEGDSGIANKPIPRSMAPLVASLRAERVNAVFADYWIAYRLDFESRERVIASGVAKTERYAPYRDIVSRSPSPGWIFVQDTPNETSFVDSLADLGVTYRTWRVGGFAVYVPSRPVHPEDIRGSGG
jgi:4-amino-4-deoxy-L-arabinose transferase-like glycosyltransferase